MWNSTRWFLSANRFFRQTTCRDYMSPNFSLTEQWDNRLQSKILQKVKVENLYCDLENKYLQKQSVTAIDVDILTNAIDGDTYLSELDDLVHKFRLTPEAMNILPSTHHAFIRSFFRYGDKDELLRILDDRLNYGIFPDDFCTILLLDNFIKRQDFTKAAKIAVLQMLQEDFSSPLIKYLSLYSCHKYLLNPTDWYPEVNEEKPAEDDGEEIKIRVKYLRNPYFDDHFDLKEPNSLVGKTLALIGDNLEGPLSTSYRLLGLVLYKKYQKVETLLEEIIKDKQPIHSECLDLIEQNLKNSQTKEGEEDNKMVETLSRRLTELKSKVEILTDNLIETIDGKIKKIVAETETDLITQQKQIYQKWIEDREELLLQEIAEIDRKNRLEEVAKKKKELQMMEEKLFFFENEDKLDIAIENKRIIYPKKWLGTKKKKRMSTDEYVPPEIVKQKNR